MSEDQNDAPDLSLEFRAVTEPLPGPMLAELFDLSWSADRAWIDGFDTGGAVHVMITPHGLSGSRSHWPGNELTADALSGLSSFSLKFSPQTRPSVICR